VSDIMKLRLDVSCRRSSTTAIGGVGRDEF